MGSPNFYTNTNNLNLGIDLGHVAKRLGLDEYELSDFEVLEATQELKSTNEAIQDFIDSLDTLYFHKVVLDHGYHNGFQVYIDEQWHNYENYVNEILKDWERYQMVMDVHGYENDIDQLGLNPIFRSNMKNLTRFNLESAIKKEYKTIHNGLLKLAKEIGLTEIVGSGYTQSLSEKIFTRKI